jgi:hypothetical protein
MKKIFNTAIIATLCVLPSLHAEIRPTTIARVSAETLLDPTVMAGFGYERRLPFFTEQLLRWNVGLRLPIFTAGVNDWALRGGVKAQFVRLNWFGIFGQTGVSTGRHETRFALNHFINATGRLALGLVRPTWGLLATVDYDKNIMTNVRHSEVFRRQVYEDAVDGWYSSTGGSLQFGVAWYLFMGEAWDFRLELRVPYTEKLNSFGTAPAHIGLQIGFSY